IASMGAKVKENPELHRGAVAGAAASSVATIVQMAVLVGMVSVPTLLRLAPALLASGLAAAAYAAVFTLRSVRENREHEQPAGRPFDPKTAIAFVLIVGVTLVASALLTLWLGDQGLLIASAMAGFSGTHAPAISAATLAESG